MTPVLSVEGQVRAREGGSEHRVEERALQAASGTLALVPKGEDLGNGTLSLEDPGVRRSWTSPTSSGVLTDSDPVCPWATRLELGMTGIKWAEEHSPPPSHP